MGIRNIVLNPLPQAKTKMVAKDGWRVDFVVATKGLNRPDTEVGGVAVNFCCSAEAAGQADLSICQVFGPP